MEWHEAIEAVHPHVFRVTTPQGSGTGFLLRASRDKQLIAVVTAAHVVDHAHFWEQPLRLEHFATGTSHLLRHELRAIQLNYETDSAAILYEGDPSELPETPLALIEENFHIKQGVEIGWLGFPAVRRLDLCFFKGTVSAYVEEEHSYLIDGVAINGVSGGPVFRLGYPSAELVGLVSAYVPNRATGETLPGLAIARDVSNLHAAVASFDSFTQAKAEETPPEQPLTQQPDVADADSLTRSRA